MVRVPRVINAKHVKALLNDPDWHPEEDEDEEEIEIFEDDTDEDAQCVAAVVHEQEQHDEDEDEFLLEELALFLGKK